MNALQWPAMVIALAGAYLVASSSPRARAAGWWCFLVSNVAWIAWAAWQQAPALLLMQVAFVATSVRGLLACRRASRAPVYAPVCTLPQVQSQQS